MHQRSNWQLGVRPPLRIVCLPLGVAALWAVASSPGRADDASTRSANLPAVAAAEASRLGDASFAARELATQRLIEQGVAARPVLTPLVDHPDAEVRRRARQILAIVNEADFRLQLEAFAIDVNGDSHRDLPSWRRFREEVGGSREARDLFVQMQRAEPQLLAELEADPKTASALFAERCQAVQVDHNFQAEPDVPRVTTGTIAALLFVGAVDEINVDDQDATYLDNIIGNRNYEEGLLVSSLTKIHRRLLGRWVAKNTNPTKAIEHFNLAFQLDLKEGADLARRLLAGDNCPADGRIFALLALGRFGGLDDLPLVERSFSDERVGLRQRAGAREVQVQVREAVLAIAIYLSGEDVKSYGFSHLKTSDKTIFIPMTVWLADDTARQAAIKRWTEQHASR